MTHEKTALVCGAGGFNGHHLVCRLKIRVRGIDLKYPRFRETDAEDFVIGDLRDQDLVSRVVDRSFAEIYQFAAYMGSAGYIFTGQHGAAVMHSSATIELDVMDAAGADAACFDRVEAAERRSSGRGARFPADASDPRRHH